MSSKVASMSSKVASMSSKVSTVTSKVATMMNWLMSDHWVHCMVYRLVVFLMDVHKGSEGSVGGVGGHGVGGH